MNSRVGSVLYVSATGVVGVILLLGFFSLFLVPFALIYLLPLIIGFNGAVSGYNLADKGVGSHLISCLIALLFALSGGIFLRLFCSWIFTAEWLSYLLFSVGGSFITAWISIVIGSWIFKKNRENQSRK